MDRIKARQQKYKKGKERMMSMNQESSDGQTIQKAPEDDDDDDDGSNPSLHLYCLLFDFNKVKGYAPSNLLLPQLHSLMLLHVYSEIIPSLF